MNVLSDFILRVDDAISVSDAKFAAPKAEAKPKTRKTAVKAKPASKSASRATKTAKEDKPAAAAKKKTVKTTKK